jgi:hypothetical protein
VPAVPAAAAGSAIDGDVAAAQEWVVGLVGARSTSERGRHLVADVAYDPTAVGGTSVVGRTEYLRAEEHLGTRPGVTAPLYLDSTRAALVGKEVLVVLEVGPDGVHRRTDLARLPGRGTPRYSSARTQPGGWPRELWVLEATAGCASAQLAGMHLDAAGHVTAARTLRPAESVARCGGTPAGWWVARGLPAPLGARVTGGVQTSGGRVEIRNGGGWLDGLVRQELARFDRAGLGSPPTRAVTFDPHDPRCAHAQGWFDYTSTDVLVCADQDTICSNGDCWGGDALRAVLGHELAHAWVQGHADEVARARFLEAVGLARWDDPADHRDARGVEWAAEVLAWALRGEPDPTPATLLHPRCPVLAAGYRALTGHPAPVPCR